MQKKRLFQIMSKAKTQRLKALADRISDRHEIAIVKAPAKNLAMIKMREPVKSSLYYLGEVMVTEAVVACNGIKGMAVTMGDDLERALYMAIIDCGFNNGFAVMDEIAQRLLAMEARQSKRMEQENAMHLKTMVNFNTMDGGAPQ